MKQMLLNLKPEDIHNFRVAYKHHRALYLVADLQQQNNAKIPKNITKIYRLAGKIRDLQLEKEKLKKYLLDNSDDCNDCIVFIKAKIRKYKRKIKRFHKKNAVGSSDFRDIDQTEKQIKLAGIESFVSSEQEELKKIQLLPENTDEQLHTARKILKNIWYALAYPDISANKPEDSFEKRYHETSIVRLMDELGNFHDTWAAIELLKESLKDDKISNPSEKFIQYVLNKWKNKKESLRSNCLNELKSFSLSELQEITKSALHEN